MINFFKQRLFQRGEAQGFPFVFVGVLLSFLLSGCLPTPKPDPINESGGTSASSQGSASASQSSVDSQNPEAEKAKVLGQDSNGDGIRDDVEKWLKGQIFDDKRVNKALNELARAYQSELEHAYHLPKSRKATRRAIQATDCIYSLMGPKIGHQLRDELKKKVFDTPLRQKWGRRIQRNFQGEQIPPVKDYSPEANCPFLND